MEERLFSDIKKHLEAEKWKLASFINDQHISMMSGIVKAVESPEFDQKKDKFVEILRETIIKMKKQGDGLKVLASSASSASSSPQDPR
jgi:hypothetical protein